MANLVDLRVKKESQLMYSFGAYTLVHTTYTTVDLDLVAKDFLDNLVSASDADIIEASGLDKAQFAAKVNLSGIPVVETDPSAVKLTGAQAVAGLKTFAQVVLTRLDNVTATTVGAAGAAAALPAQPLGYITINVGATPVKMPYYNV